MLNQENKSKECNNVSETVSLTCSICFETLDKNTNYVVTKCNHSFHFDCLIKNFTINFHSGKKCPICRERFDPITTSQSQNSVIPRQIHNNNSNPVSTTVNIVHNRVIHHRRPNSIIIDNQRFYYWPPPSCPSHRTFRCHCGDNSIYNIFTRLYKKRYIGLTGNRLQRELEYYATKVVRTFSYDKIKKELKKNNVRFRGYMRSTLEKKLITFYSTI